MMSLVTAMSTRRKEEASFNGCKKPTSRRETMDPALCPHLVEKVLLLELYQA
jgi:hypothetical protein